MEKFLDWLQTSDPADRKMQSIQGRCYHLQILCHPSCTFLPPLKGRYEKMFMHLLAVKNLCPSLNSHLWALTETHVGCPSQCSQSIHPLHFSLPAFLIRKFSRHLKPFFCSCLLVSHLAQLGWTSQQLILIDLLKLSIASPICLPRVS